MTPTPDPTAFFIQHRMTLFAQRARDAAARVRRAMTLREVRDWGAKPHDSLISSVTHILPEVRQLSHARQERATELVEAQLKQLSQVLKNEGVESYQKRVGQLRRNGWEFLRGEHAGLLHRIDVELARMEHEARKGGPPVSR